MRTFIAITLPQEAVNAIEELQHLRVIWVGLKGELETLATAGRVKIHSTLKISLGKIETPSRQVGQERFKRQAAKLAKKVKGKL